MTQTITPALSIGALQLSVASLPRSIDFYTRAIGLKLLSREADHAVLGAGSTPLLSLVERPGAQPALQATGLYHFAMLLPGRKSLAQFIVHLAQDEIDVQGAADHGVSESVYMEDPDGNGIEIYADRRRGEWPRDDLKRLQMVTEALDVEDVVMALKGNITEWQGLGEGARIGHVHLKVASLGDSERFYTQALGFDLTARMPGALFFATGGYHHQIAVNTWAGEALPPPAPGSAGMDWFEILAPDAAALEGLKARLQAALVPVEESKNGLLIKDPSQNAIILKSLAP